MAIGRLASGRELVVETEKIGNYFGRDGLWLESYGQLHTDIYGLSTATATWVAPVDAMAYPNMYSAHPIWNFLHMEKRTVSMEYGHCRTVGEYAGFEGTPEPVIEYSTGVNEEPIQTHPNFESFAGTPSSPQNGAQFRDPVTGKITSDDSLGIFDKFWSNPPNEFAGVVSYLMPVLVERTTTIGPFPTGSTSLVGQLLGSMLCTNVTVTKRGIVYVTVVEKRSGGPRGWNSALY
jgi:hypothetical protein